MSDQHRSRPDDDDPTVDLDAVSDGADDSDPADGEQSERPGGKRKKRKGSFWKEVPILIVVALLLVFLIQTFLGREFRVPSGSMETTLHGCTGCSQDRILVDKVIYDFRNPRPGDVIVFKGPEGWAPKGYTVDPSSNVFVHWLRQFGAGLGIVKPDEYDLVKRVIAVGGQTVSCCDAKGRVTVDGKPLDEPYLYFQPGRPNMPIPTNGEPQHYPGVDEPGRQAYFNPVHVPKDELFVMGDNRNNSEDSRYQNGGGQAGLVPVKNVIGKARVIIWPPSRWGGITDFNPQQHNVALGPPAALGGLPASGVGFAAVWPVLVLGGRSRRRLRAHGRSRGARRR